MGLQTKSGIIINEDYVRVEPDENGFLSNVTCARLNSFWWETTKKIAQEISNKISVFHSVYIRGSVAVNKAIPGISDIDLYVVVEEGPNKANLQELGNIIRGYTEADKRIVKVEIKFLSKEEALDSVGFRLLIGVYGKFVLGKEDLIDQIKRLKLGADSYHHAKYVDSFTNKALKHQDNQGVIRWYTKQVLRAGMELVSERAGYTTRDLYGCYLALKEHSDFSDEELNLLLFVSIDKKEDFNGINTTFIQRTSSILKSPYSL